MGAQALGETEFSNELADEADGAAVCIFGGRAEHVQATSHTDAAIKTRFALRIKFHDVREANGVGGAVMHAAQSGKGMCQRMGGAEIFLKRDTPHGCGDEHLPTRFHVLAVLVSAGKRLGNDVNAFKGDAITKRLDDR